MAPKQKQFALEELYVAYKKAKAEAFYESTHFHSLKFVQYEQDLDKNLRRLLKKLNAPRPDWFLDGTFIGDFAYVPKSLDCSVWGQEVTPGHFAALDPHQEWSR